jgi:xanthine/uracil/vitamin C permease (AzgA family)
MTLLMGLYARLPFAVAPDMGLNAFFAYADRRTAFLLAVS